MRSAQHLNVLAGDTLFGMSLVGVMGLCVFFPEMIPSRLLGEELLFQQLLLGIPLGLVPAWLALKLLSSEMMNPVKRKYEGLIGEFDLNRKEKIWISVCAGVGEEILFRGFLQYVLIYFCGFWLGIAINSVVFVAIHGYLNPKEGNIGLYGLFLTAIMVLWAYCNETIGIWSVIVAHALFDIVLLSEVEEKTIQEKT